MPEPLTDRQHGHAILIIHPAPRAIETLTHRLGQHTGIRDLAICENIAAARVLLVRQAVDLVILEGRLFEEANQASLNRLRRGNAGAPLLVLSDVPDDAAAVLALSRGATGFVHRDAEAEDIILTITAAARGYSILPATLLTGVMESRRRISSTGNMFGLSRREVEVLTASINGHSNRQVSAMLNISIRTVETHKSNIFRKVDGKDLARFGQMLRHP